jgi:hypothetical protein
VVVRVLRFVFCVTANYSINRELTIVFFWQGCLACADRSCKHDAREIIVCVMPDLAEARPCLYHITDRRVHYSTASITAACLM